MFSTLSCQCQAQHASANAAAEHERHENETLREQALQVWDASMFSRGGLFTGWESKSWLLNLARCNSYRASWPKCRHCLVWER